MRSFPDRFPHVEYEYMDSAFGFLVLNNCDLYVAGGHHTGSFDNDINVTPEDDTWIHQNNFFKYDMERNSWITLPPMELQHGPKLFECEGYIYSIGKDHIYWEDLSLEKYSIQRYGLATKRWENMECGIGESGVVTSVLIHRCLLILMYDEHYYGFTYKFGLLNTITNKWSEVCWKKSPHAERTINGPEVLHHKDNVYVIRNLVEIDGVYTSKKPHVYRLECDFECENPTVTEAEEVNLTETFGIDIKEAKKLDPRINFTFDKRKLGVSKKQVRNYYH